MWAPCLPSDDESRVPRATTTLADSRVTHYWDAAGTLMNAYQGILGRKKPAWDVYFVYARGRVWDASAPEPDYWMHQLWDLPDERRLDGERLAREVEALLARRLSTSSGDVAWNGSKQATRARRMRSQDFSVSRLRTPRLSSRFRRTAVRRRPGTVGSDDEGPVSSGGHCRSPDLFIGVFNAICWACVDTVSRRRG